MQQLLMIKVATLDRSFFTLDLRSSISSCIFFICISILFFVQMMDGAQINVDVTAPGAIIALALIFLKVGFLSHLVPLCTFKN